MKRLTIKAWFKDCKFHYNKKYQILFIRLRIILSDAVLIIDYS